MHINYSEQVSLPLLRHAVAVMAFCFLPYFSVTPWWVNLTAIIAIAYRLYASYRNYPMLPFWFKGILIFLLLYLLRLHYQSFFSSGFFIGSLIAFFWLKVVEIHKLRDIKVIVLCSIYVIFAAMILHTELWILLYMFLASLGILSLLIKMEVPNIHFKEYAVLSFRYLCIALPLCLFLFFTFPRMNVPLWRINMPNQGQIGFNDRLTPGSLSSLTTDETLVMRITPHKRMQNKIYWHGLTLSIYDGVSWLFSHTEPSMLVKKMPAQANFDYEVILEPNGKQWIFYTDFPAAAWPDMKISSDSGMTRLDGREIRHNFLYGFVTGKEPYRPLNSVQLKNYLQLPAQANPKLRAWAIEQKAQTPTPVSFVNKMLTYIHQQPFWYRLSPAPIGRDMQQLDRFWFKTKEGYCEHYASAFAFILRSANIPSRVVVGYYGGDWNPISKYLSVRQKHAHAWVEYWQENAGWQLVDPTAAIALHRIEPAIEEQNNHYLALFANWENYRSYISWLERSRLSLDSLVFFWERWLLFYNSERQQSFLQFFGIENFDWLEFTLLWMGYLCIFIALIWFFYQWKQYRAADPLLKEYEKLKKELSRLHINTAPPSSLYQQWEELAKKKPELKNEITAALAKYEVLRLKTNVDNISERKAVQLLFKSLRKKINILS